MIHIGRPQVEKGERVTRVTAAVRVDDFQTSLWVEVENQYAHGLCADRSDAFVVSLLCVAFKHRQDITFDAPMTNLLKEQIEKDFIDVVCQHQPELHHIRLTGPVCPPIYKQKTVRAMGLSCGVDCLYTVHNRMLDPSLGERYFLMSDAHLQSFNETPEIFDRRFRPLYANGKEFAEKLGIPLIVIRTNWGPLSIPGLMNNNNTTYCNCFVALAMQNLFTHYYLASGGPVIDFAKYYLPRGVLATDSSDYELLSLGAYSTPSLRFIVDGLEERVTKIRTLLDWPECWENLDVCEMHYRRERGNDTYDCHKCMHTVCEIISQGGFAAFEKFAKVFDIDYVKTHRAEYLAYMICQRLERSEVGMEIWPGHAKFGVTPLDYLKAVAIIVRKKLRKYIRNKPPPRSWADI